MSDGIEGRRDAGRLRHGLRHRRAEGDDREALRDEPGARQLGTVDLAKLPPAWTSTGGIAIPGLRAPELSGAADGRLYSYTPSDEQRGFVREIDRTGVGTGARWMLPAERGEIGGFAFAFWGDVFYVFVTFNDANEVWAIRRKTGKIEKVIASSPHQIVGAGVSTCAPLLEKPL